MKKSFLFLFLSFILFSYDFLMAQNVGVGTVTPDASAKFEVSSTNSGFLPPRMTFAQRTSIPNPATGLMVWCTDCGSGGELSVYNGTEWRAANISSTSSAGTPPLAPTSLSVTVSSPLAFSTLNWTDVSTNEAGYKIERKTGSGMFAYLAQVGSNVTTFYDSSIAQSTTYTYRAYAFNSAGSSAQYSNEFQITTYAIPTLITTSTSSITTNSVISGGSISNNGGASVTTRGVCWSTSANPTVNLITKTVNGSGNGSFTSNITGLLPNTTYHIRAYAINSVGTAYGNDIVFSTLPALLPVVATTGISVITVNSANVSGNISFDGNLSVTTRGICWSTSANPTVDLNTKTVNGSGTGIFTANLTDLASGTTYHVRAYATNSLGTAYGADSLFTTVPTFLPTVKINTISDITISSAILEGNVSFDGNLPVTARGICWSTTVNPTVGLSTQTVNDSGTGIFTANLTSLASGTTYHVRAYATNSLGTAYGADSVFTTLQAFLPVVSTQNTIIVSGSNGTVVSGGNVTFDGNSPITARGVILSTSDSPTIYPTNYTNYTLDGTGIGSFTSNIAGLSPNTTYYLRAYAINSTGISYGDIQKFATYTVGQNIDSLGGIIIYLDASGQHGLIITPTELGSYPWGCSGTSIAGTSDAIGSGAANTALILAGCSEDNIAAKICNDLVLNGHDDWYLPSSSELIYARIIGLIGGATINYWWTSNQSPTIVSSARVLRSSGVPSYRDKTNQCLVRAVRLF